MPEVTFRMMSTPERRRLPTYLVLIWAVACTAIAMVLRAFLDPILGTALPYITSFGGIAVASWAAGWRGGVLCAVGSQLAVLYFFIEPRGSFHMDAADAAGIVAFYAVSTLIVLPIELARRAVAERDRAVEQLRAESGNKSHFLALLAHELRGPVHSAKLALRVADDTGVGAAGRRDAHSAIARQIDHVQRLCEELLDTAKIEQGRVVLERRPTEITTIVARAVEESKSNFEKRSQQVEVVGAAAAVQANVDAHRMVQVIRNLLDNASKYSPTGTNVLLETAVADDTLIIKVIDHGRGFEPAVKDRLFEQFFQASPGSDGLGLGLPLVRKLVELHGGKVTAMSVGLGTGATFEVRIPGALESHQPGAARAAENSLSGA